jgi:hypothetical protein
MEQLSESKIQLLADTTNFMAQAGFGDEFTGPFRQRLGDQFADFMDSLEIFAEHEWFWRVWTVQEYVRSKQSPVGVLQGKMLDMGGLSNSYITVLHLRRKREFNDFERDTWFSPRPGIRVILGLEILSRNIRNRKSTIKPLAEQLRNILVTLISKDATLPHDHIYGLLGLTVGAEIPPDLLPDYKMPFQHVYHTYTRYIIENTGSLDILGCNRGTFVDLPCWVPDFRNRTVKLWDVDSNNAGTVSFLRRWQKAHSSRHVDGEGSGFDIRNTVSP